MKSALRFILSVITAGSITGATIGGVSSSTSSCTPAAVPIVVQDVPIDVVVDVGCWVADILAGTQSVAQMAAQCGALTLEQIAALLNDLEQGGGIATLDAGVDAAPKLASSRAWHIPRIVLAPEQRTRIDALRTELVALDGGAK
jgi:hypothetical protein